MLRRVVVLALGLAALAAAPARAGDPIMPLSQVQRGMHCQGRSVVQGTAISTFDVEILDVIAGGSAEGTQILVRVSGPAVDVTGIGEGFSGSPIYCPDGQGVLRNAGAIDETVGEFGNKTVLATPIEAIIGQPVEAPRGARRLQLRSARRLLAPLTVTGLPSRLARILVAAGRRARRAVIAAPRQVAGSFAPTPLVPGASVAVGLSSGDLGLAAIGTVAYADGDAVWGFGHPLDGVGRRSLLLEDAYVFTVINNPIGAEDLSSYKLAVPGQDVGTLSNDTPSAVVGRVGPLPPRFPLQIDARDPDSGAYSSATAQVADENPLDLPSGTSALNVLASLGVAAATDGVLRGAPVRQSNLLCLRIKVAERRDPFGFCNTYFGPSSLGAQTGMASPMAGAMASDVGDAVSILDDYNFATLHVESARATILARRGLRQAFISSARGPTRAHPGQLVPVRLRVQLRRGPLRTLTFRMRVPRSPGVYTWQLEGTPADGGGNENDLEAAVADALKGEEPTDPNAEAGPRTLDQLANAIGSIHRFDGVTAKSGGRTRAVFRDPELRISGATSLRIAVTPRRAARRHRRR